MRRVVLARALRTPWLPGPWQRARQSSRASVADAARSCRDAVGENEKSAAVQGLNLKAVEVLIDAIDDLCAATGESPLSDASACALVHEQVNRVELCVENKDDPRRELQKARQLFKHLVGGGHAVGEQSYSRLVEACAVAGEKDLAEKYMEDAKAAGVRVNIQAINSLLLLPKYGGLGEGFLTYVEERGLRPNEQTYEFLLMALRDAGDAPAAMGLMSRLRDEGISTPAIASYVMQTLIAFFSNANDFERLNSTVLTLLAGGLQGDIRLEHELPMILAACARHVQHDPPAPSDAAALAGNVWGTLVRIPGEDGLRMPPAACYHSMLRVHAAHGRPEEAERVLADLEVRGEKATDVMWARVAEAHAAAGDEKRAEEIRMRRGL